MCRANSRGADCGEDCRAAEDYLRGREARLTGAGAEPHCGAKRGRVRATDPGGSRRSDPVYSTGM